LGENINTVNKNTETTLDTMKEVNLNVNAEKTVCMHVTSTESRTKS